MANLNQGSLTEYVSSWLLGILDCNTEMGNETAGYYCINFKIVAFGNTLVIMNIELQHRGINFWIATFGKINILNNFSWTWRSPQTTNNIISPLRLNFEFPMENDRRKLNWLHLKIYLSNGNSVQLITKFETETKFATLFLNDRKSQTLSLQKCLQKGLKMLQKYPLSPRCF